MARHRFRAVLESAGRGGHAIPIPGDVVEELALRQHSRVSGIIAGASYRSSTARYGGRMILGVHKATVAAAGIEVGQAVDVEIEPDGSSREVRIPPELEAALRGDARARAAWDRLPPSRKREHADAVAEAKKPETKERRVARAIASMRERG
jgi:Bacteriocin-protection, YdeI or OmpD-Associated/Domain of unknown function (DUF1905)